MGLDCLRHRLRKAVSSSFVLVIFRTRLSRSLEQASQQVDDVEGLGGPFYSGTDPHRFPHRGRFRKIGQFFFINNISLRADDN